MAFSDNTLFLHESGEFPIRHGRKITVLYVPTADHSKCWGLYPSQGIAAFADDRKRTACIDTHQPVGFASCLGRMIEIVVTVSRFEIGKSLTNSLIGEGGNPQAVERLMAIEIGIDVSEDKLTLPACIGGNDDAVSLVKTGAYHFELLQCRRV